MKNILYETIVKHSNVLTNKMRFGEKNPDLSSPSHPPQGEIHFLGEIIWEVNFLEIKYSFDNVFINDFMEKKLHVRTYPIRVSISLNWDPSSVLTFWVRWQFRNKVFHRFSAI